MKKTLVLLLSLILCLAFCTADAQTMTAAHITAALDADETLMGDAETAEVVKDLLDALKITIGGTADEDSFITYLKADVNNSAAVDVLADMDADGVLIATSSMPDEAVRISWKAAAEKLGITEDLNTLTESLQQGSQAISGFTFTEEEAAPYLEAVMSFTSGLEISTDENVTTDLYPAPTTEVSCTVNAEQLASLLSGLTDVLDADEVLDRSSILSAVAASAGSEMTWEQLISALRSAYDSLKESGVAVTAAVYQNNEGVPVAVQIVPKSSDGTECAVSGSLYVNPENSSEYLFSFSVSSNGQVVALTGSVGTDENGILNLHVELSSVADGASQGTFVFDCSVYKNEQNGTTAQGTLSVISGDTNVSVLSFTYESGLREDGTFGGAFDADVLQGLASLNAGYTLAENEAHFNLSAASAAIGLNNAALAVDIDNEELPAIPENVTVCDDMSDEELTEVGDRISDAFVNALVSAVSALPESVVNYLNK